MSSIERKLYGPGWLEVTLGALLSFALGVIGAVAFLAFKPVAVVKELPKAPEADVVYFIEGTRESSKSGQATNKEKLFLQGRSVELNEDELNVLSVQHTSGGAKPPAKAPANGKPAAPAPEPKTLALGSPNFRVRDGVLQIEAPLHLSVNAVGLEQDFTLQSRGSLVKQGDTFVFTPNETFIGSCPLHRLPAVQEFLYKRLLAAVTVPPEYSAAWHKLANATIEGSKVKLTMQ